MKSIHCVMSNRHFDDQYTLNLDGFMTPQEFLSTMTTFNQLVEKNPPPPSLSSGLCTMLFACFSTIVILLVIAFIHYTRHLAFILILPFTFLFLSGLLILWRRRLKRKFENAILHLCSCMNATENVRGINYRLSKLPPDSKPGSQKRNYNYAITIEFDERYNLLHHFASTNQGLLPPYKLTNQLQPPVYSSPSVPQYPQTTYQPNEKL
ncbi:hypothetical protein BJ944DRAFT_273458 [Cunninghamella echinulata]|nr:hypothetical protein BJ944DRAFT_273458 [Cunninghamella echinulata]